MKTKKEINELYKELKKKNDLITEIKDEILKEDQGIELMNEIHCFSEKYDKEIKKYAPMHFINYNERDQFSFEFLIESISTKNNLFE